MINKIKKIIIAYIANNFKLSNKLTRVENNLNSKISIFEKNMTEFEKSITSKIAAFDKNMTTKISAFEKNMFEFEMLLLSNFIATKEQLKSQNQQITKNHFLLFDYNKHIPKFGWFNLGDYVQTIATHNALKTLFPTATYQMQDRDTLSAFNGGGFVNTCYYARLVWLPSFFAKL